MSDFLDDLDLGETIPEKPQETAPTPGKRGPGRPRKGTEAVAAKVPDMPKEGVIAEQMSALYSFAAVPLMMVKPKTAVALMEQSDEIGRAWESVAKANPKVRAALLGLAATSTWGALAMAHVPVIMALMSEETVSEGQSASAEANAMGAGSAPGRHAKQSPPSPMGEVRYLVPMESGGTRGDSGSGGER